MQDARSGETLGYFYMDLYPREGEYHDSNKCHQSHIIIVGKYGHAAMWDLQSGSLDRHGRRQAAVAAMVCNFPRPSATTPSLMEHKQVRNTVQTTYKALIVNSR